jgi:hypothetical protein
MNMRIRDESEYCISITRFDPKHSRARVSDWTIITVPYHDYRLTSLKASTAVTFNQSQSPGYLAYLNSDQTKNNFLSNNANTLAEMFTAGKKIEKQNRRSGIGRYRITQRNVVFENRMFDLNIVN